MADKRYFSPDVVSQEQEQRPCPFCHGRGLTSHPDAAEQETCGGCDGTGILPRVEELDR